jgi:putative ABC transport system permease protein
VRDLLRAAARSPRRSPLVATAAIVTVALAVAINTVIMSAVEGVVLRSIAVPNANELVAIETGVDGTSLEHLGLSTGEVYDLGRRSDLFRTAAGFRVVAMNLTGTPTPERVSAIATIGSLFDVLRVQPYAGRFFTAHDVEQGDTHVVALSYEFWQSLTGGDAKAIGRELRLDGQSYRVIGILPPGLHYPAAVQLWTPQPPFPGFDAPTNYCCRMLTTVARLRRDMTVERARSALATQMNIWRQRMPKVYATQSGAANHPQTITAVPLTRVIAGDLRPIVLLLAGATAALLLLSAVNLASLQLVSVIGRTREIAIRSALGAGRARIAGQLIAEAVLVTGVGGLLGVVVGAGLLPAVVRSDVWRNAVGASLLLDWRVFAFSAVVTMCVALAAAAAPVLHSMRIGIADLSQATRGATNGPTGHRVLRGAVVVQVALSLVLLLGCILAVRSLDRILVVDPGFRSDDVMRMRLALSGARYSSNPARIAFADALLDRLRHTPGVVAVGTVSGGPFSQLKQDEQSMLVQTVGDAVRAVREAHTTLWIVGGDYFDAMRIPIRAGRKFDATDNASSPKVWLVDSSLAQRLYDGERAIGQHIDWPGPVEPTIIGVVGAVKKTDLSLPDEPSLYWSYGQYPQPEMSVVVRSTLGDVPAAAAMRNAVRELDPDLPIFDLMSLDQGIQRSIGPRRLASNILATFAAVAVALAALGMFGVLNYVTTRRRREIAIRIALGADARRVVRAVVRTAVTTAVLGIAIGIVVFLALGRVLGSLVFGVGPRDPLTLAVGVGVALIGALAASYIPAGRAASVDPVTALRED